MIGGHGGNIYEMARRHGCLEDDFISLKTPSANRMLAEKLLSLVDEPASRLPRHAEIRRTVGI